MKVLVCAASRHGATTEIAEAIGGVLSTAGIEADVRCPEEVNTLEGYDGVVLGSGVYAGRWLDTAKQFIERESKTLSSKPVWLFSSGPLGNPAKPEEEPPDVAHLRETTRAIDHRIFAGRLDRRRLGLGEKAIVAVVHAPDGDFRPWSAVIEWASDIVRTMRTRDDHQTVP
ncbi:MAG TPA: flavodoxin domain-containing protein [Candidatus Limnocylindrales bacterium]|nr:flavodoxin domain-containing protein [Candidatus Limnocylindrales bacterium]